MPIMSEAKSTGAIVRRQKDSFNTHQTAVWKPRAVERRRDFRMLPSLPNVRHKAEGRGQKREEGREW